MSHQPLPMRARWRSVRRDWSAGWACLRHRRRIPGYAVEHWASRIVINHHAALRALRTQAFWRGLVAAVVLTLALQVLAWRCDLRGAARDLPFFLPALLVAPRAALGRRRLILRILRDRRRAAHCPC